MIAGSADVHLSVGSVSPNEALGRCRPPVGGHNEGRLIPQPFEPWRNYGDDPRLQGPGKAG